jgi:uncharacterized protein YqeY
LPQSIISDIQTISHVPNPPPPYNTLSKAIKKRQEAKSQMESRPELASQMEREVSILEEFIPTESEKADMAQVEEAVREAVQRVGRDLGKVIKEVRSKLGPSAEGKMVADVTKRVLLSREGP